MPKKFFSRFQDEWVHVPVEIYPHINKHCLVCVESNFEGVELNPSIKDMSKKKFMSVRCANCKTAIGSYSKKVSDDGRILESPEKIEFDEEFEAERDRVFNEANKKLKEGGLFHVRNKNQN